MVDDINRIERLRRQVHRNPASIAFAALAEAYRRVGRYEDAVATCRRGLRRHPAYLSPRVTLGRALLALGRVDEARQELERVCEAAPGNLAARHTLDEIEASEIGALAAAGRTARGSKPAAPPATADPALRALESFLAAIGRVRQARSDGPARPDHP